MGAILERLPGHLARFFSSESEAEQAIRRYQGGHRGATKAKIFNELAAGKGKDGIQATEPVEGVLLDYTTSNPETLRPKTNFTPPE